MFFTTLFLVLILSPGLRGLPYLYFPLLFISFFFVLFRIYSYPMHIPFLFQKASIPHLFTMIIYILILISVLRLDNSVSFSEFFLSLSRLTLAASFLAFSFILPRTLFYRSLFIAIFLSASLGSLVLYLQAIFGISFDFLSADSSSRALLVRYSSTMGSLTAASVGLPFCTFSYFYLHNFLSPLKIKFTSFESLIFSIPKYQIFSFWLFSTFFTLSRTALFTSLIVLLNIYVLPPLLQPHSFMYRVPSLIIRKSSIYIFSLLTLFVAILFRHFSAFINVVFSFVNPESSASLTQSGVNNVLEDFIERLFMFDDGAFEFVRFFFGQGYHHVSGSLGITSAGKFSHNTFVDLFHIFGIIGPILLSLFCLFYLYYGFTSYRNPLLGKAYLVSSANFGFLLMMLPTFLTTSGVLYVPLFMIPLFVLYFVNSSSYSLSHS